MAHSFDRISSSLRRLSRTEQRNLLLQAGFAALAAWALGWSLVTAAVNLHIATPAHGTAWILGLFAVGLGVAVGPARHLRAAGDLRRQAQRVEELRPELQGALLTVLDRTQTPRGSPALLARLGERAHAVVVAVRPSRVHPATTAARIAALSVASIGVLIFTAVVLPRGPFDALAALRAASVEAVKTELPVPDGPRALVGDITLRYLYPTYTGREPLEVPNSNGEVHAPPGTIVEVRARTAEAYPEAALVVYERERTQATLNGRDVSASFTVEGPGTWRFVFSELPSPDYRIVPDPDLPPDVSVQAAARALSGALDKRILLPWTARDDFGLARVVVEVNNGGHARMVEVRKPTDAPRELADRLQISPKELGLSAGDVVKLRVGAWDNDAVSGSKVGWSSVIELEVLGPHGREERQSRYRKQLRDALVLVLADFLVDPVPAASSGRAVAAWGASAAARYEAFDTIVHEAWGGAESDTFDSTVLRTLREKRRSLFAFASGVSEVDALGDTDRQALAQLQDAHLSTVENAILMFDQVLRAAAQQNVQELVQQAAREATELQEDFASLDKQEALARLDQLARMFSQLAREAAKLDEGGLRDFVNDRAETMDTLMDEIRKAIAEGRMDDAKELMDRLAQMMKDMAGDLDEMQKGQQGESRKLQEAMEKLKADLESLQKDQQALREKTEEARDEYGQDMQEAVEQWQEIERLSQAVATALGGIDAEVGALAGATWSGGSAIDEAKADANGLLDSARARDLDTALQRSDQLYDTLGSVGSRLGAASRRSPAAGPAQRTVDASRRNVQKIRQLLEQMAQRQANTSPALQRALQQMAAEQSQLAERADAAAKGAKDVAGNLPMDAPGLQEGTERGAEQAERASEAMREGDAMSAEGGQRGAEDGFREALDAMAEAERNLRQMQQASQGGSGDQKGQGQPGDGESDGQREGEGSDGMENAGDQMSLPAPEAFQTPEAYRRALLEGMEGEVPEEYKSLNRRYYEELVRQ